MIIVIFTHFRHGHYYLAYSVHRDDRDVGFKMSYFECTQDLQGSTHNTLHFDRMKCVQYPYQRPLLKCFFLILLLLGK